MRSWSLMLPSFPMRSLLLLLIPLTLLAQTPVPKLEAYLLMPEPFALRTVNSRAPTGASKTVLSPAHEIKDAPGVKIYSADEFTRLGISVDTFTARAKAAAETRLAQTLPEFVKDEQGNTRYAVYRSDSPLIATLLVAPSLGKLVSKIFKTDVWAVVPDRHSLYLFPAKPELVDEFTDDLKKRYETDPYAASAEIFLIREGEAPRAIATFGD